MIKKVSSVFAKEASTIFKTLYTQPLSLIFKTFDIGYHFYADDSQLYKACSLDSLPQLISTFETCTQEVKTWMCANKLKLNVENR